LFPADHEVLVGELVGDIPSDGSELPPVLDDGVEKAEAEKEPFVLFSLFAFVEVVFVQVPVGPEQVVPQSLGRLQRHLDTVLKDGN
jgi:hypothetical protein